MIKTLLCAGHVVKGIFYALIFMVLVCAATLGPVWAAVATANWLDVSSQYYVFFFLGYVAILVGAVMGGIECRTSPISRPHQGGGK